jgi:predicted ATPase/class 3 adenylate cyclase
MQSGALREVESVSVDTTILFTDIEGSTRLWESDAARMSQALARHDAIARAAVEANRGVIVKTTGDGLYAAFADPADGLNASLTMQRSLRDPASTNGVPLLVRCGLHHGAVERRDNDYFGPPVNRTARIMSVAHGGQILVSQAVVDNLGPRLPAGVTLRDLGGVRLKDLTAPEHVYQLLHPELRQDFPALRSLEATPNNLPQQLTSFVGREREMAEAKTLLTSARLVTLLGMGGLGKTRLSLQIAADVLDAYPDGVWFLDLAPIRDPSLVASQAAQALGLQEQPGKSLKETLCAHAKDRKLLLIFDNCEHVVAACADLVNALLRAAPALRVLATSREALRVPGEQTYPVMPLDVPDKTASVDVLARSDAVQLFVDRARLHKPSFLLTDREAPAVAELCARLEGIPLALELAAARVRTLPIAEINHRLRDRFKLLTGGGRVLLERQQTLRALVDWSYDLLENNERLLFDRLSVFAGGFELAACEAICGSEPLAPDDVLDVVTSLVDKSLVMASEGDESPRYRTLETIRDYARERLTQRGELLTTATRHCDHYLTMAKAANAGIKSAEQPLWIRRLEADLDNLRAGMTLALESKVDPVLSVKFEVALLHFWLLRGYSTEGRKAVRMSLALPEVQAFDVAHAHALYVGAALANSQGEYAEAERMLTQCLALRRGIGNLVDLAATLSTLSLVQLHAGDAAKARAGEEEALGIFRQLGDRIGEAIGLHHLGEICLHVGDDAQARAHFEQCLAIAREIEHRELEGECERMLGEIALESGDVAAARARFARAQQVCEDAGDKRDAATALWWSGRADVAAGDLEAARTRMESALRALAAFEMNAELLGCLEDLAFLAHARGLPDHATHLYSASVAHRERLNLVRPPRYESRWRERLANARSALGDAAFEAAWAEGARWKLEDAVRRALIAPTPVPA